MRILKYIFVVGIFPFRYGLFHPYPPLSPNALLVAFYAVCFVVGVMLFFVDRDQKVTVTYLLGSLLPWLLAGFFLANGALDHSNEDRYQTVVVNTHYRYRWPGDEVIVRSWRSGRTTESFYEHSYQRFYRPGDRVTVGVKSGALGTPWVNSISREH
jgi:hypothetical protein